MHIKPIRHTIYLTKAHYNQVLQFTNNTQNNINNSNNYSFFTHAWNNYVLFCNKIMSSIISFITLKKLRIEVLDKSCHEQIVFLKNYLLPGNENSNCSIMSTLNALRAYGAKNHKLFYWFNNIEEVRKFLKSETNYIQFQSLQDDGSWLNEKENGFISNLIPSLVFQKSIGKYAEHWTIRDLGNKQKLISLKYLLRTINDLKSGKVGVISLYFSIISKKHLITILDYIPPDNSLPQGSIESLIRLYGEFITDSSLIDTLPNLGYFLVYDQAGDSYSKLNINEYLKHYQESEITIADSLFSDQKDSKEFSRLIIGYTKNNPQINHI